MQLHTERRDSPTNLRQESSFKKVQLHLPIYRSSSIYFKKFPRLHRKTWMNTVLSALVIRAKEKSNHTLL